MQIIHGDKLPFVWWNLVKIEEFCVDLSLVENKEWEEESLTPGSGPINAFRKASSGKVFWGPGISIDQHLLNDGQTVLTLGFF